jgi:hypothetical protein
MDIQRRSHAGVTTIAVLQLVFGGLGLACEVCALSGVSARLASGQAPQDEIRKIIEEEVPSQKVIGFVGQGISLVLSVLMVTSGVGLLQMKPWGRSVAIGYAILSIINRIAIGIYGVVMLPTMQAVNEKVASKIPNGQAMLGILQFTTVAAVFIGFLFIIYPIVVLLVMRRPDVRAALTGAEGVPFDAPRDFDDRERGPFGDVPPDDRYRQPPDDRINPQ